MVSLTGRVAISFRKQTALHPWRHCWRARHLPSPHLLNHGLTEAQYLDLAGKGIDSLSKLAFAVTTPGTTPTEDALRRLLNDARPEAVTLGDLSAIRRLMFSS